MSQTVTQLFLLHPIRMDVSLYVEGGKEDVSCRTAAISRRAAAILKYLGRRKRRISPCLSHFRPDCYCVRAILPCWLRVGRGGDEGCLCHTEEVPSSYLSIQPLFNKDSELIADRAALFFLLCCATIHLA